MALFLFSVACTIALGIRTFRNEPQWYVQMALLALITLIPGVNAMIGLLILTISFYI